MTLLQKCRDMTTWNIVIAILIASLVVKVVKKELENLKKLEKLKPYALLIIGGRASRSTTLRNSVHYALGFAACFARIMNS